MKYMFAKKIKQKNPLPSRLLKKEANASRHINILGHYNNETLIDKSGKLIQIIQLSGINGLTQSEADLDAYKNRRNSLLKSISGPCVAKLLSIQAVNLNQGLLSS